MSHAWLQCAAGASGDMFLGALVDAGAPIDAVRVAVKALEVEPIELVVEATMRGGVAATRVRVVTPRSSVVRTWGNVRGLLEQAALSDGVRARALDVFARLARAEATAHRTSPEQVHFHEVGALDALADVVGTAAALEALGVTDATSTAVALGSGMSRSAHGLLPVPGPAVVALLSEVGAPVYSGDAPYEMCTPTGAALLASVVTAWGGLPPMRVASTGHGAGSRDVGELPNVLRVVIGERVRDASLQPAPGRDEEVVVEANVDDLDPRLWPTVLQRLMAAGAADAWLTPIVMKKGRPAHTLSVLVGPEHADAVRQVVFAETPSIGLREWRVTKRALAREVHTVVVDGQRVRVKTALVDGRVVNGQPEYEDVAAAAEATGRPLKAMLAAANAAAHAAGLVP
jgi:pyridinium-3,5-bisthiocarboxylic acid mononucleotide nickel chelatase